MRLFKFLNTHINVYNFVVSTPMGRLFRFMSDLLVWRAVEVGFYHLWVNICERHDRVVVVVFNGENSEEYKTNHNDFQLHDQVIKSLSRRWSPPTHLFGKRRGPRETADDNLLSVNISWEIIFIPPSPQLHIFSAHEAHETRRDGSQRRWTGKCLLLFLSKCREIKSVVLKTVHGNIRII